MNGTNDTLESFLNKSAQELGHIILSSTLGIETDMERFEDLHAQVDETVIKWVAKNHNVTEKELSGYLDNTIEYTKELDTAIERFIEIKESFSELYQPYVEIMNKLSTKRNSIYFVREETEQNAWRMAYFIKELRMSELQKKYNEPIDNEQMLLENLTSDDMQSIQQSYNHIALGLSTVYAWQDFIKFLSEHFENETLIKAIEADAPSEAPIKALRAEAGRTKDFITEYAFEWRETEQQEKVIRGTIADLDKEINYYIPLIMFGSLLDIKRTDKESYIKITSAYTDYTVEDIAENTEKIITEFKRKIVLQDKGVK